MIKYVRGDILLKDLIKKRRSVRKYKDKKIDREVLENILMYASMGPSNGNSHPVEFIVVDDKEKIEKLSEMNSFATMYLKEAPAIVIVMANTEICKTWVEEASIAASYLQLLCEEEGLSTCWINVKEGNTQDKISYEEYFKDEFGVKSPYRVQCLIPIGYKKMGTKNHEEFDISSKVHYNEF